ncbi:hypothetical protein B1T45_11210 [Mycobacterium kansasii]|uniref:Uncharacterized protein n=3 Tax=Mycobacterium kansasii TaxID=1768 RepID=A0A1V3WT77_MYCKA|nr:hypothetical protein MKAN_18050 [Mycobacterium kansasii ATCC 12478]ARG56322.1 hypothetical protein B1T43_11125 [Mycobacterium kansasii]EUA05084.1 hypothetical protein I547_1857 [Mycobacterium kansasii 824]EUA15940.1 hypothetical protein I545_4547 [Mycobacterium kansasii 662]ARG61772.1 hypothetical protein B1T45_11210 [Mycobacterium kansasii]
MLHAGQRVASAALGLVAALGLAELSVVPRRRVLVVSTGSERHRRAGGSGSFPAGAGGDLHPEHTIRHALTSGRDSP